APAQTYRLLELRNAESEDELGSEVERLFGADARPPLGNVLGVIGKEGVEPLVFDLQLDGRAILPSAVRLRSFGRHAPKRLAPFRFPPANLRHPKNSFNFWTKLFCWG